MAGLVKGVLITLIKTDYTDKFKANRGLMIERFSFFLFLTSRVCFALSETV